MYIRFCKYCKKEIEVKSQQLFAAHVASCEYSPSFQKRMIDNKNYHIKREIENRIYTKCGNCEKEIITKPHLVKKSKSGNSFCSSSCSSTYNNRHKTTGNRRSKLEAWIEKKLKDRYNFEIIFNGKEAISSELDIYIPSLKLAFELNGIFHYEPIFGKDKLDKIKNNDDRKFQACLENEIEFCIIDTSSSKNFKPERDIKYLEIIDKIIDKKMRTTSQYQQQQINPTDW